MSALEKPLPMPPGVWRGRLHAAQPALATGFAPLDAALPGGGWPLGALTEVLGDQPGLGLDLLLPALRRYTGQGRCTALVTPPFLPYPQAFLSEGVVPARLLWVRSEEAADALWAAEQLTRSGAVPLVAVWSAQGGETVLRRLQLAAEEAGSLCVLFRPLAARRQSSPAALRLVAVSTAQGLSLEVIKNRGGRSGQRLQWPVPLGDAA